MHDQLQIAAIIRMYKEFKNYYAFNLNYRM